MENKFEFYPYKHDEWTIYGWLLLSPILLLLTYPSFTIHWIIISIISLVYAKLESDLVPTVVILDDEGFEIRGKAKNCYPKTKWEDVRFGQYTQSYYKSNFIILSSKYIDSEEARRIATQQRNTRQLVIEGVPVILITESDTSKEFRKRVEEKIHIKPLEKYQ
ncbi:MAG: hypothetical protein IKV52_00605 [Oscillospiraceae bacterium]|nr:hypothetical protein [Oscillospiraceae bacterium]